ncbi:MAG: type II toxin-antitoxin system VapC family toxin [Prevotellaceae bacterium]|jgi:PIN domain nuclease of toxin-antitoxin system|nr:type II toxin-antitoxin system VapC family toxin [Prevotellaceae bacterium]
MRYLIDTNILAFYLSDSSRLEDNVLSVLQDYENNIFVSSEVMKEVIQLIHNGKLDKKKNKKIDDIFDLVENEIGFSIKYINQQHLKTFEKLPVVANHNDPNDRLIIAQSIAEKIPLISSDRKFENYRKYKLDLIFNE